MKKEMDVHEAVQALQEGKVVFSSINSTYLWQETINDPIDGPTKVLLRRRSNITDEDIVPHVTVLKDELTFPKGYTIFDPETEGNTLSVREAYAAMEAGLVVYDVDIPDCYYFLVTIDTPFGRIKRVFWQDEDLDNKQPEISYWNAASRGIARYRVYNMTPIQHEKQE